MDELLSNPAVQVGVGPLMAALVVAFVVALILRPLQLGGLAVAAAFLTTMYFVSGLGFSPLTATRKIIIVSIAAPVVGMLIDFAFKPTRMGAVVLALCAAASALWVFWPVLAQKPTAEGWLLGASMVVVIFFVVGFSQLYLAADAVRAGAAGLGLGLATGIAAILSASVTYGLYGIALGAGAGGFLLPQMISGKKGFAGATFTLSATLTGGLVAAGAMVLAKLPWYALLVLALVPVGARLPAVEKTPLWLQAVLLSLYCFAVGAAACALAWAQGRNFDLGFMSLQL